MENSDNKYEISNLHYYSDLALESAHILDSKKVNEKLDGITISEEEYKIKDETITVTHIEITSEHGSQQMSKPIGNYITLESQTLKENDEITHEAIVKILVDKLSSFKALKKDSKVLIVGLGNWNVTPDSLGPKVISKVLVTSHMMGELPEELVGKVREVCVITPGVMGITGLETGEIIKGIVDHAFPDLVIAVDALAARSASRINATIQISDTGINPGSGVGNKRMGLNFETLGVPVIAIGVPTVIDAATLVNDSIDLMINSMISQVDKGAEFYKMLKNLEAEEKYDLIKKILDPYTSNMFVTPKEVDIVIDRLSKIISNTINITLHTGITKEDINRYQG